MYVHVRVIYIYIYICINICMYVYIRIYTYTPISFHFQCCLKRFASSASAGLFLDPVRWFGKQQVGHTGEVMSAFASELGVSENRGP